MIDLTNETLIPFRKLPAWCEQHIGRRPHPSCCHRWRTRGVRGVKLETILFGGERCTSELAMQRFSDESTAAADGVILTPSTPPLASSAASTTRSSTPSSAKSIRDAEAYLDDEGI